LRNLSPFVRFMISFFLLVLLMLTGTMGYVWIERWPVWDGFYMTVITVSTVGFGEVRTLSQEGQQFTVLLLVCSLLVAGYSVSTLIGFIFEGQIFHMMRGRRMERSISKLRDHYIICGCGVVGKEVALEFQRAGMPFVIVDQDPQHSELARDETVLLLEGDAEDDEALIKAGIQRAKGLIAALRNDDANVFVVLTARQLNPALTIVSRATDERTAGKILKAGANRVFSPDQIVGRRMASVILRPSVVNFLEVVMGGGDVAMRLEEVPVVAGSPLIGKQLRETNIGQQTGSIVVSIQGSDGGLRVNPSATATLSSVVLQEGDLLIALGSEGQLKRLKDLAAGP